MNRCIFLFRHGRDLALEAERQGLMSDRQGLSAASSSSIKLSQASSIVLPHAVSVGLTSPMLSNLTSALTHVSSLKRSFSSNELRSPKGSVAEQQQQQAKLAASQSGFESGVSVRAAPNAGAIEENGVAHNMTSEPMRNRAGRVSSTGNLRAMTNNASSHGLDPTPWGGPSGGGSMMNLHGPGPPPTAMAAFMGSCQTIDASELSLKKLIGAGAYGKVRFLSTVYLVAGATLG